MEEQIVNIISNEDKKYIRRVCNNNNIELEEKLDILCAHYQVDREEMTQRINSIGMSLFTSQFAVAKLHTLQDKKRYIITSAQTASPVNLSMLQNIEAYAEFIDAEIGIIATRYKNPTSIWKEQGDVWDVKTHKYLTANRQQLHPYLLLLADLKIQATSPNPTNGVDIFGGESSVIIGSPIVEMVSSATLPNQPQKFIYSTGSITLPSFTDTVAGGKAAQHHDFGFVIVEIENDEIVHVRNVVVDKDGSFNDLIYRVENQTVTKERTDIMVWGDSHFAQKDDRVTKAFRQVCTDLGIKESVLHDIWDSESINVHNIDNAIVQNQLEVEGKNDLEKELENTWKELTWFEQNMKQTYVISSNHDDMLDRAMNLYDWKKVKNKALFVEMLLITLKGEAPNGLIAHFIDKNFKNITAFGKDDSFIQYDTELALHGHIGPNGSKGNIKVFGKLPHSTITGHGHSPMIKWGCYQVGISCKMQHGYNRGLSGWAYASCTLNKYGKKQMIILNQDTLTYTTLY